MSQTIIHIDGDAFFASCEQAVHPEWRGRPVVTGKERGIVSAASYEAKARGVARGVPLWDVKKLCPDAIIVPSDYETYSLFSKRMFAIMRRFTPLVEEYSIDEAFADVTGLDVPSGGSYGDLARRMKEAIESDLGITVSVGVASTKTLAKVGSKWNKPSGITVIPDERIADFLGKIPPVKIWGIGAATAARCDRLGLATALDFARCDERFIRTNFAKPYQETWHELNSRAVWSVDTALKAKYASISKTKTFTPPSSDGKYVYAQLLKNLENACIKARRHGLATKIIYVYLVEQGFRYHGLEARFTRPTAFPAEMSETLRGLFTRLFQYGNLYRATGVVLAETTSASSTQLDLFEPPRQLDKLARLYRAVDDVSAKFGKHAIFSAASAVAHKLPQHILDRGDVPLRKLNRLPGETKRKHLAIPLLSPGVL